MIKRIEIQIRNSEAITKNWVDITNYVEQGIQIRDSVDGTLDSGVMTLNLEENALTIYTPVNTPIKPRTKVRYSEIEESTNEYLVDYYFETSDTAYTPIRNEQYDDKNALIKYFYTHELNLIEVTKELEGKMLPSFSVTQPKNLYDKVIRRDVAYKMNLTKQIVSTKMQPNYNNSRTLPPVSGTPIIERNLNNLEGVVSFNSNKIKISKIGNVGLGTEDYVIGIKLNLSSTAPSRVNQPYVFGNKIRKVYATSYTQIQGNGGVTAWGTTFYANLPLQIYMVARFYKNSALQITDVKKQRVSFLGDLIGSKTISDRIVPMGGKADTAYATFNLNTKGKDYDYVEISVNYGFDVVLDKMFMDGWFPWISEGMFSDFVILDGDDGINGSVETAFNLTSERPVGVTNREPLIRLEEVSFSIISSMITEESYDKYTSCLDLVNKALVEVNLKERKEYVLSKRLETLLSTKVMPEAMLQDLNLKELLNKVCRLFEVVPILGDTDLLDEDELPNALNTISYVKPGENTYELNSNQLEFMTEGGDLSLDEYYDKISARVTNLVPEDEYITERVPMGLDTVDRNQITDSNAAFITSQKIYWVRAAWLKGKVTPPRVYASYKDGQGVTQNMWIYGNDINFAPDDSVNQKWDISSRLFEYDIYQALPDVNYSGRETEAAPAGTARKLGLYSKGSCVYYKSGEKGVLGITHMSPSIPTWFPPYTTNSSAANYAMIEMIAVLAMQKWSSQYTDFLVSSSLTGDLETSWVREAQLEIVYVPLDEGIYRYTSNSNHKKALNIEKRVQVQDRVVSLKDTDDMVRREQIHKGLEAKSKVLRYPSVSAALKTAWKTKDGYVITQRVLHIFKEYVDVTYTLSPLFLLQADNIKLNIEFERYAIPYEFVRRELLNLIYIMVNTSHFSTYWGEKGNTRTAVSVEMLKIAMGWQDTPRDLIAEFTLNYITTPSGLPTEPERKLLAKLHKWNTSRGIFYLGSWNDNYGAGNQLITYNNLVYSQPVRYTDTLGKVKSIQYKLWNEAQYDVTIFPEASALTYTPPRALINNYEDGLTKGTGNNKDAREAYEFMFGFELASHSVEDNRIISFAGNKAINKIGFTRNIKNSLTELTRLEDINLVKVYDIASLNNDNISTLTVTFRVTFNITDSWIPDESEYEAIILYYDGPTPELRHIIKTPNLELINTSGNTWDFKLYVSSTRWGRI